jgi:hypothetical protein
MEKEPRSRATTAEIIEGLKSVVRDIEKVWAELHSNYSGPGRQDALANLEKHRAEMLSKLARLEDLTRYEGATNLANVFDTTVQIEAEKVNEIKKIIEELKRQINLLTAKSSPSAKQEAHATERELRVYQEALDILEPPENPPH